jgi:bacterioferritin-associated ferredoxin
MIVCSCYGVSDRTVKKLIDDGACSLGAVQKQCGAGGDCGSCKRHIANLIDERAAPPAEDLCWTLPLLQTG